VDGLLRDPVRPQRHRPAQDLSRKRFLASAAVAGLLASAAGCGDDSADWVTPGAQPTPSGTLSIALPRGPTTLDPLQARTATDRLIAGQIYEPLTRGLTGPYGETERKPGLALSARPGVDQAVWRVQLRPGVRFHDGARFTASALLANAERWRTTPEGQALLPGLVAADAPRPNLVRFIFDGPNLDLMRQLASVRLGVVSPRALRSGPAVGDAGAAVAGTGPFELHDRRNDTVLLARNPRWWGTRQELGPAVELVELRFEPSPDRRLRLLRGGAVQVADSLGSRQVSHLRRDPLLTTQAGAGEARVGLERSVRGFHPAQGVTALSRVWLTTAGTATG
jgi:peptide/nickel transport system substrate-binding protein